MKSKCNTSTDKDYKNNGALGIKVCNEWETDFNSFYLWAINHGYKDGMEIDRIDINNDWSASNCRWITKKEKRSRRRDSVVYTYNGKTQNLESWSRELGIKRLTLWRRIHKSNWSIEKAFTTPVS